MQVSTFLLARIPGVYYFRLRTKLKVSHLSTRWKPLRWNWLSTVALGAALVLSSRNTVAQDEQVTVTGFLNTILAAPEVPDPDHPTEPVYLLVDSPGHFFSLTLDEELTRALGGALLFDRNLVRVTGIVEPETNTIVVGSIELEQGIEIELQESSEPKKNSHLLRPHVLGSKPWVTILCRFADATTVTPQPASFFDNLMNNTMDPYYREQSY